MTVKELMARLVKCDPEAEVWQALAGDEREEHAKAARVVMVFNAAGDPEVYICDEYADLGRVTR